MQTKDYIIRGGIEGRERLRILSRVMQPTTHAFLKRAGAAPGMLCWDVGCGGGEVACDLAQIIGPSGRVIATDIDKPQLAIAASEAKDFANVEFRYADITQQDMDEAFDFIHARFVLTHLPKPAEALGRMKRALKPGGILAIEDIEFAGHFSHPPSAALSRYVELYRALAKTRGADADIGPRLPSLFAEAGFQSVRMNVVQPAGHEGEVKLMSPITLERIAPALLEAGLASKSEIEAIAGELYAFAQTPGTVASIPRVFEVWALKN